MITNMNTATLTTCDFWAGKHNQKTWSTMSSRQRVV